jgi:hypothetical protein
VLQLYGMQVVRGNGGGGGGDFENDTEVAAKEACFLLGVSLKRRCSRFPVAIETSQGQSSTASDVHCRDLIVEGGVGLALRVLRGGVGRP